jgi:hypothetical protein
MNETPLRYEVAEDEARTVRVIITGEGSPQRPQDERSHSHQPPLRRKLESTTSQDAGPPPRERKEVLKEEIQHLLEVEFLPKASQSGLRLLKSELEKLILVRGLADVDDLAEPLFMTPIQIVGRDRSLVDLLLPPQLNGPYHGAVTPLWYSMKPYEGNEVMYHLAREVEHDMIVPDMRIFQNQWPISFLDGDRSTPSFPFPLMMKRCVLQRWGVYCSWISHPADGGTLLQLHKVVARMGGSARTKYLTKAGVIKSGFSIQPISGRFNGETYTNRGRNNLEFEIGDTGFCVMKNTDYELNLLFLTLKPGYACHGVHGQHLAAPATPKTEQDCGPKRPAAAPRSSGGDLESIELETCIVEATMPRGLNEGNWNEEDLIIGGLSINKRILTSSHLLDFLTQFGRKMRKGRAFEGRIEEARDPDEPSVRMLVTKQGVFEPCAVTMTDRHGVAQLGWPSKIEGVPQAIKDSGIIGYVLLCANVSPEFKKDHPEVKALVIDLANYPKVRVNATKARKAEYDARRLMTIPVMDVMQWARTMRAHENDVSPKAEVVRFRNFVEGSTLCFDFRRAAAVHKPDLGGLLTRILRQQHAPLSQIHHQVCAAWSDSRAKVTAEEIRDYMISDSDKFECKQIGMNFIWRLKEQAR